MASANVIEPGDYIGISNLIARYAYCADYNDPEGFAELFTDSAKWERITEGKESEAVTFFGKRELAGIIIRIAPKKVRHHIMDILIESSGPDTARAKFRALITDWREETPVIARSVTYWTDLLRTSDGWKFSGLRAEATHDT